MGNNLPVVHEVTTSLQAVGDVVVGDTESARRRVVNYYENSVIGSGVLSAAHAISGNSKEAKRVAKGMARATGSALLGGGMLRNVPIFQEVATIGDSLGDVISGDVENVDQRVNDYFSNSLIGSTTASVIERCNGNEERSRQLAKAAGKSALSGAVSVAGIGVGVLTGGFAAPIVGASLGTTETIIQAGISGNLDQLTPGEIVGSALVGGIGDPLFPGVEDFLTDSTDVVTDITEAHPSNRREDL